MELNQKRGRTGPRKLEIFILANVFEWSRPLLSSQRQAGLEQEKLIILIMDLGQWLILDLFDLPLNDLPACRL